MGKNSSATRPPSTVLQKTQGLALYVWRNQKPLIALVLIAGVFGLLSKHFFTFNNLMNVARQASIYAVLAAGMTLVLTLGEIDLSVGANAGFCGVMAAFMLKRLGVDVPLAFTLVLCIGGSIGLLNGLLVAKVRVPFFITTLATMSALTGASYLITRGYPISLLPKGWQVFGRGQLLGIPVPVIIMVIAFILLQILQSRTVLGRKIYAVGANTRAARLSGIQTDRVRITAYTLCGVLAALGGILISSRLDSGDPSIGPAFLLTLIAAPILGGTKLSGGEGTMIGTLIGALVLGVINNAMSLLNLNTYWQDVARGMIVLAIVIPQLGRKRS